MAGRRISDILCLIEWSSIINVTEWLSVQESLKLRKKRTDMKNSNRQQIFFHQDFVCKLRSFKGFRQWASITHHFSYHTFIAFLQAMKTLLKFFEHTFSAQIHTPQWFINQKSFLLRSVRSIADCTGAKFHFDRICCFIAASFFSA